MFYPDSSPGGYVFYREAPPRYPTTYFFYISFLAEKICLSCTSFWQVVPRLQTVFLFLKCVCSPFLVLFRKEMKNFPTFSYAKTTEIPTFSYT